MKAIKSLAAAALAVLAFYSTTARAAMIVQPASAYGAGGADGIWYTSATSGGAFDPSFGINGAGLSNASLVADGQPDIGNAGTTLSNLPTHSDAYGTATRFDQYNWNGWPPILTLYLGSTARDLTGVYLWNYTENYNGTYYNDRGLGASTIFDFYNASGVKFDTRTVAFSQAPNASSNLPQYISFGTTITGAVYVNLNAYQNQNGWIAAPGNPIVGFDEIRFIAVPEPTTWALLAGSLTVVMVLRRRRKD